MARSTRIKTLDEDGRPDGGEVRFDVEDDANVGILTVINSVDNIDATVGVDHRTALALMAALGRFAAES